MRTVKIKVSTLRNQIKQNRDKHAIEFQEAQKAWRNEVILKLESNLANAKSGGEVETFVDLPAPVSHIEEYNRLISMLEWTEDEIVELGATEFDQYVNDNWNWKQSFVTTNSLYLKKAL